MRWHLPLPEEMGKALAIGLVERLQLLPRTGITYKLMTGQERRGLSPAKQALRRGTADHIDNHRAGDGRSRAGRPVEACQADQAIAGGTLIVNHNVGVIHQLFAGGVRRFCLLAMRFRDDRNHRQSTSPGSQRHFDHYRTDPAGRNYDESVIPSETKTAKAVLGVAS